MEKKKMAWVKLLTGAVTDGGAKDPGSVCQFPEDEAERLIAKGYAEEADEPAKRRKV